MPDLDDLRPHFARIEIPEPLRRRLIAQGYRDSELWARWTPDGPEYRAYARWQHQIWRGSGATEYDAITRLERTPQPV